MKQTFTIPGRLPALNEVIDANRSNVHAGNHLKRTTQDAIALACKGMKPMHGIVDVTIVWYEGSRRRDPDNVMSAIKFILDALVECAVLEGDSQRHIRFINQAVTLDRTNPRVEVTLEEAS